MFAVCTVSMDDLGTTSRLLLKKMTKLNIRDRPWRAAWYDAAPWLNTYHTSTLLKEAGYRGETSALRNEYQQNNRGLARASGIRMSMR